MCCQNPEIREGDDVNELYLFVRIRLRCDREIKAKLKENVDYFRNMRERIFLPAVKRIIGWWRPKLVFILESLKLRLRSN